MATIYQWNIVSMPSYSQIDGQTDVVFQVNWQCVAWDTSTVVVNDTPQVQYNFSVVTNGSVPVAYTAGSPFTPYADLSQEQVWGWINPSIDRPEIEANLQDMIDVQKNPPVVTPPLPWAQTQGA
jgi:hypothetical protein